MKWVLQTGETNRYKKQHVPNPQQMAGTNHHWQNKEYLLPCQFTDERYRGFNMIVCGEITMSGLWYGCYLTPVVFWLCIELISFRRIISYCIGRIAVFSLLFRHNPTVPHWQAVCRSALQSSECTYLLLLEWGTMWTQPGDLPSVSGGSIR
jgi:hypothetical protein